MAATLNRPERTVADEIERANQQQNYAQRKFIFTGDTSTTDFALPKGWIPFLVFGTAGDLQEEGGAADYTVAEAHGVYTITFAPASAPAAANFIVVGVNQ